MALRKWLGPSIAAVAIVGGIVALAVGFQVHIGPVIVTCLTDDEITAADRASLNAAATAFLNSVLAPDPRPAYAAMSRAGRVAVTPTQLESAARGLQAEPSDGPLSVQRTYLLDVIAGDSPTNRGVCSEPGGSGQTFANVDGADSKQGHVLLVQPLKGAKRTFDVWMGFEGGAWRVNGFYGTLSEIAGHDGQALWAMAKAQRAKAHSFNATLLYYAASQSLARGPYLQLAVMQDFWSDQKSFKPAPEMAGTPPYRWSLGGQAFSIANVTYEGFDDGKIGLLINQAPAPWKGERDADQRNRRLTNAFMTPHPEWTETFDAIIARSPTDQPNTSFGTVYQKDGGYLPAKPGD